MREKWDRTDYSDATIARAIEQTTETWTRGADTRSWTVPVAVKRRGPMIVAGFSDGSEAIWHTMTDLASFARSQAILVEATQVLIPAPPRRSIKAVWEPAVHWILRLAGTDRISSGRSMAQRATSLQREIFTVSRELEYFSADELEKQIGYTRDMWWPAVIVKETLDNGLDAANRRASPLKSRYASGDTSWRSVITEKASVQRS
jgi:hypothetical protein